MAKLNNASKWRMDVAGKIAPYYAAYANVEAVVALGGVARGWADAWSDLDLVVYWREPPTEAERQAVVKQLGGQSADYWDTFDTEPEPTLRYWAEDYTLGGNVDSGFKIDVGHHLSRDMVLVIDAVTQQYETHPLKLEMLYSIKRVQVLYGAALIQTWVEAAGECPEPLACRLVEENLRVPPLWSAEASAMRNDWILYSRIMMLVSEHLLKAVVALNREYYPGPKRQTQLIGELTILPDDFDQRLGHMNRADPATAIATAYTLYDEVLTLAQAHLPGADLDGAYERFHHRRKQWEHPPEGVL